MALVALCSRPAPWPLIRGSEGPWRQRENNSDSTACVAERRWLRQGGPGRDRLAKVGQAVRCGTVTGATRGGSQLSGSHKSSLEHATCCWWWWCGA